MTGKYSPAKTVVKAVEYPFMVAIAAAVLRKIGEHFGHVFEVDVLLAGCLCGYGMWKGLLNWIKNRKRGRPDRVNSGPFWMS